ncbi:MAG TPA: hypothetical protein VF026_27190 [Ktedonobacteraceae bacterium]
MRQESLRVFANLFVSRRDDYAVQQADGRYRGSARPLTYSTLLGHLHGVETIGTYVIDERGMCRYVLFDDDYEVDDLSVGVGWDVVPLKSITQMARTVTLESLSPETGGWLLLVLLCVGTSLIFSAIGIR